MIASMTGYGRGEARGRGVAVAVEIRTVNHRHLETSIRLPVGLWELEPFIKREVQRAISRGRVEVFLHVLSPLAGDREPLVDTALAGKYLKALRAAGKRLKLASALDLSLLVRLPDVVRVEERPVETAPIRPLVKQALLKALRRLAQMRLTEGRRLGQDIRRRVNYIQHRLTPVELAARESWRRQEQQMRLKVADWLGAKEADNRRLVQELISKQLRSDVTEEVVRLRSHLEQFHQLLSAGEPVGRQMDFLLQEIGRELNTLGAKSVDAKLAHQVVGLKEEMEKIREQVQNLE
ncbi:MAG: YicC/YloC family endoribonuclease [candidate division FCPU426 bacterium]